MRLKVNPNPPPVIAHQGASLKTLSLSSYVIIITDKSFTGLSITHCANITSLFPSQYIYDNVICIGVQKVGVKVEKSHSSRILRGCEKNVDSPL